MNRKEIEVVARLTLDWCIAHYGLSKYHHGQGVLLEIEHLCNDAPHIYGEFDTDEVMIVIYAGRNRSIPCLVNTIIHEYQHYLQPPTWITRYSAVYGDGLDNPYEQIAESTAQRDSPLAIRELHL